MYDIIAVIIGEGNGNPLQCSCLENPRDGGAWWAAVYGVSQRRTRLKRLSSSSSRKSHFSNLLFNWTIAALQDGAGFCHAATGTSPHDTHVPSLSSPPTPPWPSQSTGPGAGRQAATPTSCLSCPQRCVCVGAAFSHFFLISFSVVNLFHGIVVTKDAWDVTSPLLNLLRLASWPSRQPVLETVPRARETHVYRFVLGFLATWFTLAVHLLYTGSGSGTHVTPSLSTSPVRVTLGLN